MQPLNLIMSNIDNYRSWIDAARGHVKSASEKMAASVEASDPTNKGNVTAPGNPLTASAVPRGYKNDNEVDHFRNIINVTDPNGTGQGEYMTPRNGNAVDASATSPTASLDKIANNLRNAIYNLQNSRAEYDDVYIPTGFSNDNEIMRKLAGIGQFMLGTEEGQRAVTRELEKQRGIKEASMMIAQAQREASEYANMQKMAYIQRQIEEQEKAEFLEKLAAYNYMEKQAAEQQFMEKYASYCENTHRLWLDGLQTPLEKLAYMQGAVDGEQAAQSMAAGGAPMIEGADGGMSDTDVVQIIQEMVQSGQIAPEEAEAILQAAGGDPSPEAIAEALRQLVQSGQIAPDEAQMLAEQILGQVGGAPMPADPGMGGAPMAADPGVKMASVTGVSGAAGIVNELFA